MADTVRTTAALAALLPDNTSGLIVPQNIRDLMVSSFNFTAPITGDLGTPDARTIYLDVSATEAYTINSLVTKLATGTVTVAVQINGTNVTGLSAVSVTTTKTTTNATAANTVSIGNDVTMVVSAVNLADGLCFKLNRTRS